MATDTTQAGTAPVERTGLTAGETKVKDSPANGLAPATEPEASGAMTEPAILEDVDTKHPALDPNPRRNVPPANYQIDLNDPTLTGQEAVEKNLGLPKA